MRATTAFGRGLRVAIATAALAVLATVPAGAWREEAGAGSGPPAASCQPEATATAVAAPERGEAGGRRDLATEVAKASLEKVEASACAHGWGMLATFANPGHERFFGEAGGRRDPVAMIAAAR